MSVANEDVIERLIGRGACEVAVGAGWLPLLSDLDDQLSTMDPDYTVMQVKEKFGGLRFHYGPSTSNPYISGGMAEFVWEAMERASATCESCGQPGVLRRRDCLDVVRCDEHAHGAEIVTDDEAEPSPAYLKGKEIAERRLAEIPNESLGKFLLVGQVTLAKAEEGLAAAKTNGEPHYLAMAQEFHDTARGYLETLQAREKELAR